MTLLVIEEFDGGFRAPPVKLRELAFDQDPSGQVRAPAPDLAKCRSGFALLLEGNQCPGRACGQGLVRWRTPGGPEPNHEQRFVRSLEPQQCRSGRQPALRLDRPVPY